MQGHLRLWRCTFNNSPFETIERIQQELSTKIQTYSSLLKQEEAAGKTRPSPKAQSLMAELKQLLAASKRESQQLQVEAGISAEEIEAYEQSLLPKQEDQYWRHQFEKVEPTGDLDEYSSAGLERLLSIVDLEWLEKESCKTYRLDDEFRTQPLEIVNGRRVNSSSNQRPQRFARMLLTCKDNLAKRNDLDFFEAATLVPEIAMLGAHLEEIQELGPVAV